MKMFFRILLILLPFFWSICAVAQKKQNNDCAASCFSTQVVSSIKISETCTAYEWKISYYGVCAHALSHFTVGIPCGTISSLSNSQHWKQVIGTDPTTGLTGFKIDDIPGFGDTALKEFIVEFVVCTTNTACENTMSCWKPVVAYKASTCVKYDTLDATCTQLRASLEKKDASCFGKSDGALSVIIEQGQEPYTFLWSNGSTASAIQNVSAGSYSVTVKDASGAALLLNDSINQPNSVSVFGALTHASCNGINNGAIDLSVAGGAGDYTFLWNNGATTEDIDSLAAGSYKVSVTDSNTCTVEQAFTINNTISITAIPTKISPDCNGANGSIDLSVTGGTAPYTYAWSNGSTTEDLTALIAGRYTVVITDSQGCSVTQTVDLRDNNTLKLSATAAQTSCLDNASGSIDLTVTGGTEPYTHAWTNGATTEDLSGLTSGYYTVTVTDAGGCTKTLRVFVSKKTFVVPSQVIQPLCTNDSTGSVTLNEPVGGVGPYTYTWSTGETGNSIDELSAGTYSVILEDNTGCSRQLYFVIINPSPLTASAEVLNTQCNSEGYFTIDLTVSGGTQPYSYQWIDGSSEEDRDSLMSGKYSVTITDANGCTISKEIIIDAPGSMWSCTIMPIDTTLVCGSINNVLQTSIQNADHYTWAIQSVDPAWSITNGSDSSAIVFTAGTQNSIAIFTLSITKDGCTQTCSYTLSSCTPDGNGEDPGGEDPGGNPGEEGPEDETCEECFDSSVKLVAVSGSCYNYEVEVNTNGNCRHELSHWSIAIGCGQVSNLWNSEGWKMETGLDPTTGITGLKVDDINNFGKTQGSFLVRFTVCRESTCVSNPEQWNPKVAYKAGQCMGYDTVVVNNSDASALNLSVYPNPFSDEVHFEWQAASLDYGRLEILNQFGQTITTVFEGSMDQGQLFSFQWTSSESSRAMYYYKLTTSGKTAYGKLFKN